MGFESSTQLASTNADIAVLMRFIEEGKASDFEQFIKFNDDIGQRDFSEDKWRDLLSMAIDLKSYECAKILIDQGANVHSVFDGPFHFGENLLGFAIQVGAFDIARLLLEHGAKAVEANNTIDLAKYNASKKLLTSAEYHQLIENIRLGIDPIIHDK